MSEYVICVFGSGGVGKSCLTMRFVQGNFVDKYDPTIEDVYKKTLEIDGTPYDLEILDTAGSEEFSAMREMYVTNGHGFVLVYSITSRATFNEIQRYYNQIVTLKDIDTNGAPAIVLVGNKCDSEPERVVPREDGQNLARKWKCSFLETSAKAKINVGEIFYDLVRQINRKQHGSRGKDADIQTFDRPERETVVINTRPAGGVSAARVEKERSCCVLL